MSCERYASAIVDHACGAEIAADAAAHLDACAECRRIVDQQRQVLQDLDHELKQLLAIEPSSRFEADVMARVQRPRLNWGSVMWWAVPAAAAALLLFLVLGSPR